MIRALTCCLLLASPALAQSQQVPEPFQAQYLMETGQLRMELGKAQAQNIQLRKENAELKAKTETKTEGEK